MSAWRVFLSRLRALLTGSRRDADLADELQAHLDMLADDHVRRGLSPAAARDAARREFGGLDQVKEIYRDQRSLPWLETFAGDLRYGARLLWRSPGFTAAAILSLTLGFGATSAIFSLVNASLLKELPVPDPARVVAVSGYVAEGPGNEYPADWIRNTHSLSYPLFREVAASQRSLSGMAASGGLSLFRLQIDGESLDTAQVNASFVSANYFSLLGVRALRGRAFTEADSGHAGEGEVAILGYSFWQRHFGGDATAIGRKVVINEVPFTIIGVAPRGFYGDRLGMVRDLWVPILMQPRLMTSNMLERRSANFFRIVGRLAPGVSEQQANLELTSVYQQLKAQEISSGSTGSLMSRTRPEHYRLLVAAGTEGLNLGERQRFRRPFVVLLAVTGVVLLIACGNVANLLMARGAARQREIAVRMAVGASRGRLVRQLLVESLLLAAAGVSLGLVIAGWSAALLVRYFQIGAFELLFDSNVAAFAVAMCLGTTVLFGVLPAFSATSVRCAPAALAVSFRESGSAPRRPVARGLVVLQVGLSLWLLIGAGLLLRTLQNFSALDVGLDRHRVLMVSIQSARPVPAARGAELQAELTARLTRVPGIAAVSFSSYGIFTGGVHTAPVRVPDSAVQPDGDGEVRRNYVSPGYFRTLGMTLLRGRELDDRDRVGAPRVAIINETMARHYFGRSDPVGKTFYFPGLDDQRRYIPFDRGLDKAEAVEIVGVVRDAMFDNLRDPVRRMAYSPLAQSAGPTAVLLRTTGTQSVVLDHVRNAVAGVDPNIVAARITTLDEQIERTLGGERTLAGLLGIFGGLAALLACVGLYGVMAYGVARRRGEIGVRIALGASRAAVVRMVISETMVLVGLGVAVGVPAALGTTHLIRSLLFGLSPHDPPTIAAMTAAMAGVGMLSGGLPARRASRVDPVTALRCE